MNIGYDLKLTQEQKLIMTIEMQQSIKLLQMSSYELLEHIDKEIQENVVLEYDEQEKKNEIFEKENESIEYNKLINYLQSDNYDSKTYYQDNGKNEVSPFNFLSNSPTLKDYLKDQIIYLNLEKREELICKYIIDNLDDRGYLMQDIIDVVTHELNIKAECAKKCLNIVQSLEPIGVGARNLSECLLLQVRANDIDDDCLEYIIKNYLYEVSEGKNKQIAKELNISIKDVQNYEDMIRKLEPKPSRGFFTGDDIGYVVPDVYIRKINDNFVAITNESLLPNLTIDNTYKEVLFEGCDKEASRYIKKKLEDATHLIKSIENRKSTVLKVVNVIIELQKDFLNYGEDYLRPMTIKNIADEVGMHESTISRAVKDKYASLPNGKIVKLRKFFSLSASSNDDEISSLRVKKEIRKIVDNEKKEKPYSDSAICTILKEAGMDISRRTVAKYREELNIKSSTQRKRI